MPPIYWATGSQLSASARSNGLSAGWEATKSLTLRAGVQNLFDKAPPFSQQAYFFLSGYDPSYTDPRGRFAYVSAKYSFR